MLAKLLGDFKNVGDGGRALQPTGSDNSTAMRQSPLLQNDTPPKSEHLAQRIAAIDVLRLFAASYVLVFNVAALANIPKHALPPFSLFGHVLSGVPSPFSVGATGVSLFFVISGYCMYRSLAGRGRTIAAYFQDRFARIYPIYAVAVISSYLACIALSVAIQPVDVAIKLLFLQGFFQQYHLTMNGAFWSMGTEVQFYLALPWLMSIARRMGLDRFVIASIALAIVFRILVDWKWAGAPPVAGIVKSTFLMNMLPGRIAEFAIGMWIAGTAPRRTQSMALWLCLPAGALAMATKMLGPAFAAEPLLGVFYGCILVLALRHARLFGRSESVVALIGRASYVLFLIHLPIAMLISPHLPKDAGLYGAFSTLLFTTVVIAIPLSVFLHVWVEMPIFRRLRSTTAAAGHNIVTSPDGGAP